MSKKNRDSNYDMRHEKDEKKEKCDCNCDPVVEIKDPKLANAYVPFQRLCDLYKLEEGLKKGTIFPELYMPYKKSK